MVHSGARMTRKRLVRNGVTRDRGLAEPSPRLVRVSRKVRIESAGKRSAGIRCGVTKEIAPMGRNANGRSSIYENAEGWHGRVTVGVKDNGSPDRRHVRGKTKAEVTAKVRKLEKQRNEGRVPKAGQRWRVAAWLTFWVQTIAASPNVSENTYSGYSVDVRVHAVPRNRRALARQTGTRALGKAIRQDAA